MYIYIYFRFCEPKLVNVAAEAKTRYVNSPFARHKTEIAMLNKEKIQNLDISVQQEINMLSWLHTMAPGFLVNGSKVKIIYTATCLDIACTFCSKVD